jgi:hypothetical protein
MGGGAPGCGDGNGRGDLPRARGHEEGNGNVTTSVERATRLTTLERGLLLVPLASGLVFGLAPLLAAKQFALTAGGSGTDLYIYRLAGAATFGYVAALAPALLRGDWAGARIPVIAVLGFNVASIVACLIELLRGQRLLAIPLILVASVIITGICGWVLARHQEAPGPAADLHDWAYWFLVAATILAVPFGLLPLLFPSQFGQAFGFKGLDTFTYRQGGAALCGYALMGLYELRSRSWAEIRFPAVMVIVFNGLAAIVSVLALAGGTGARLAPVVAGACILVAGATAVEFVRRGQ